jgi:hypothetical protein
MLFAMLFVGALVDLKKQRSRLKVLDFMALAKLS